ncbi:MAG: tyrosine-type recombinase/integrase [Chloroflexi bacterium]|nr:tyrosine-type recombinase/integrase [Chloroflexota bacterium]
MLTAALNAYLTARRAVGFRLRGVEGILRDFVAFASAQGDDRVRRETVFAWVRSRGTGPERSYQRLLTVIRFARYLHAEDERHEIPPEDVIGRHTPRRKPPFLFGPGDVEALVRSARSLRSPGSLQPEVYATLFGLLAATGLRISEALDLRIEDITPDGLVVQNAKFGKSRLLPLHATTRAQLDRYLGRRLQEAGGCPFLFVSVKGRQLHQNTARGAFPRVVFRLGISSPQGRTRPRLHDLRFYFANQALTRSPGDHDGISRHMVALATYLGHNDARNGYWYLEATPALFANVAARCEEFARGGAR